MHLLEKEERELACVNNEIGKAGAFIPRGQRSNHVCVWTHYWNLKILCLNRDFSVKKILASTTFESTATPGKFIDDSDYENKFFHV